MNGKADPYIEVSLRPGQKKFTTSIKTYCLNPTFNETEEFSVTQDEMETSELVLKVMDSDFPQADELIGVIRLPLKSLDFSIDSKQYSCLISHDKVRKMDEMTTLDAAKLNLRISKNDQQLEALKKEITEVSAKLQKARERTIELRNNNIELGIENNSLEVELETKLIEENEHTADSMWSDPESDQKVELRTSNRASLLRQASQSAGQLSNLVKNPCRTGIKYLSDQSCSSPSSLSLSPEASTQSVSKAISGTAHQKCLQNLNSLRNRIVLEDQKISQLRNYMQALQPSRIHARKGAIEVGLTFFHISSRLKISLLSASKLHVINAYGHVIERRPNPYVKIKIFLRNSAAYRNTNSSGTLNKGSRRRSAPSCTKDSFGKAKHSYYWRFKTQIAEDTTTPAWNEHFEIDEIAEEDLPNMYIEITVMDNYPFLPNKALGQIRIGPGQHKDNQHWEEMIAHHGAPVVMTHVLEDI